VTRRTAKLIWAALVAMPLLFAVVASAYARTAESPGVVAAVFWLAVVASAVNVALSRVLPPRLGASPGAEVDVDAVVFTRLLVGFALCDAAALAPLVAYMVTSDVRLLALGALDVLALVLLYPSDLRWEALRPPPAPARAARRGVS
jgi:hypothetical protein